MVSSVGFQIKNAVTNVAGVNLSGVMLKNGGIASTPIIGMPITTAGLANEMSNKAEKVGKRVEESLNRIGNLVEVTGVSVTEITQLLKVAVNQCASVVKRVVNASFMIYNSLLDVLVS